MNYYFTIKDGQATRYRDMKLTCNNLVRIKAGSIPEVTKKANEILGTSWLNGYSKPLNLSNYKLVYVN